MPEPQDVIADFIQNGGRVVKVQQTIPVTAPEVLDYLVACGLCASYSPRNLGLYIFEGKVLTLRKLIDVANEHRRIEELPPFVARISPFRR